ncbi:MAG: flagellar hook protein FlgE [bacterium]
MLTSLYTGVSGINAHMSEMSVVGNNLANMNTYGFKGSRSYFEDIINQSLSGVSGDNSVGLGVLMSAVMPSFTQGAFETTENPLDLAVDGSGFFVMKDADNATFYTRAGQFKLDKDGYIVNQAGLFLQGFQVDSRGNVLNSVANLQVTSSSYPPQPTAEVAIQANLHSDAETLPAFDVDDTDNTSNFATTVTVFDSLGNGHPVDVCFRKDQELPAGNLWEWYAVIDADAAQSGVKEIAAQGTLQFTSTGALDSAGAISYPTGGFDFSGGAAQDQQIAFNFGTSIADSGTGLEGVTQFGAPSGVYSLQQDGYESGSLQGVSIDDSGMLTGSFSNGKMRALGQVALADFPSASGLQSVGQMLFCESPFSGTAVIGTAGNEGMGAIRSNTLELSNVDLAGEFVRMITAQKGFQANSKVITTTDEILTDLVNLKR